MLRAAVIPVTALLLFIAISLPFASGQSSKEAEIPPQLHPIDPEIRALTKAGRDASTSGDIETATNVLQTAISKCKSRNLTNDLAIAEGALGTTNIVGGNLTAARENFNRAFAHASETTNYALQATLLTALASLDGMSGNYTENLKALERALSLATRSKSLYVQSFVLGERGRVQLLLGQINDARQSFEWALDIDTINHYSAEVTHRTYLAFALLAQDKAANRDAAVQQLNEAIRLSGTPDMRSQLILATSALARLDIEDGKPTKGLSLLTDLQKKLGFASTAGIDKVATTPFIRIQFLETLAQAYDASKNLDAAFEAWKQLYEIVSQQGAPAAVAESAERLAEYCNHKKRFDEAAKYYADAATGWKAVGNIARAITNSNSAAAAYLSAGQPKSAFAAYNQVRTFARSTTQTMGVAAKRLEFASLLQMSEALRIAGDEREREAVLIEAQPLMTVGDIRTLPGNEQDLLFRAQMNVAISLAVIAGKNQHRLKEFEQIFRALSFAALVKDQTAINAIVAALRQEFEASTWMETVKGAESQQTTRSWRVSRIVLAYGRVASLAGFAAEKELQTRQAAIWTQAPLAIVAQKDGAVELESAFNQLGDEFDYLDIPGYQALSAYYLYSKPDFARAVASAEFGLKLIRDPEAARDVVVSLKCNLALAQLQLNDRSAALKSAHECAEASKTTSLESQNFARITLSLIGLTTQDLSAEEPTRFIISKFGDSPEVHVNLAEMYAANGNVAAALEQLRTALKLLPPTEPARAARTNLRIAELINRASSPAASAENDRHCDAALELYKSANDFGGQAMVMLDRGYEALLSGNQSLAFDRFRDARLSAETSNDDKLKANAEVGWAASADALGHSDVAEEHYRLAAQFLEKGKDYDRLAAVLMQRAYVLGKLYRYADSLDQAFLARDAASVARSVPAALQADFWLGVMYETLGEFTKSIDVFKRAQHLADDNKDLRQSGTAAEYLAGALATVGEWDQARIQYEIAIERARTTGNADALRRAYVGMVEVYSARDSNIKDYEKARQFYDKATQLKGVPNATPLEMSLLELYLNEGRYDELWHAANTSYEFCKRAKDMFCQVNALLSRAEAERNLKKFGDASKSLAEAEALGVDRLGFYTRGRFNYGRAGLDRALGKFAEAIPLYRSVVDQILRLSQQAPSNAKSTAIDTYSFIIDELIDTYASGMKGGSDDTFRKESFSYVEATRAQQLVAGWGQLFVNAARQQLPTTEQEAESQLDFRISQLQAEFNGSLPGQSNAPVRSAKELESELSKQQRLKSELVARLRQSFPVYAQLRYPVTPDPATLPLNEGEVLVEFKFTADSVFVWIVKGKPACITAFYKASQSRRWIDEQALRIRDGFNVGRPDTFDPETSEQLFDALFPKEIAATLISSTSIVFVSDGSLALLPLEMLSPQASKGQFVLADKPTVYFPSATAFNTARTPLPSGSWDYQLLALGDPVTSPTDPRYVRGLNASISGTANEQVDSLSAMKKRGLSLERIPATGEEVQSIAALFSSLHKKADVLLGLDVRKERLLHTDLTKYKYVHFATHGLLPVGGGVTEPALVLSDPGNGDSARMLLKMSDILTLQLKADLVVLSACNTGTGTVTRTEGVMNLGRAFLLSGARSVTISLWQVADESTSVLMQEFYRRLLRGEHKSVALAHARRHMLTKGFSNPYFWAPFVLTGE